MSRPFIMYPDRRLRTVCKPVLAVDDSLRALWEEMLVAMYGMPGVGLAAPQLGDLRRVIVVDASDSRNQAVRMANPEVLHASGQDRVHTEGSPNLPGLWAEVTRPRAVTVAYLAESGARVEREFVGLAATSVQHQIDHLDGRLFVDHLSPVKRKILLSKHAKQMKRQGRKG